MVGAQGGWRLENDRDTSSVPPLGLAKVKAIAQQDESIGRMGVGAISLIARCTDAFLADLVGASADRARAAGHREPNKKIRKRTPATSEAPSQQVLPEDVRKAVTEDERFDFLRPILSPPQGSTDSLGGGAAAAATGAKGKRKSGPTSGRAGTGGAGARNGKSKKRMEAEFAGAAGTAAASVSDIQASGSAMTSAAGAGRGGLLALAGLDEEGRRRALLGELGSKPPAAFGLGDDEDEDYDNY